VLAQLAEAAPWLDLGQQHNALSASDDLLDAVVASLTARAVAIGTTILPDEEHSAAARQEGWIHLPNGALGDLVAARSTQTPATTMTEPPTLAPRH
jgi:hypothetical protein